MRRAGRMIGWSAFASAAAAEVVVHQRVPWIPVWYLAAIIALPVLLWWGVSGRFASRAWRWSGSGVAVVALVALCPVPWMKAQLEHPPGTAWQIDHQLLIDGEAVDPPGDWYWLTAGRPPIVAELLRGWLLDRGEPVNLLAGRSAQRPAFVEPAAAAVGLRRAGWPVHFRILVEVSDPVDGDLPTRALLSMVNGVAVTDRASWEHAVGGLMDLNTLTTSAGDSYEFVGRVMPFRRVDVIDQPDDGIDVSLGGRFAGTPPAAWFRNLSVGSSHGLMIAIVSYVYASGEDLASGRTIAGTGGIRADGTVREIGDLWSKATAARDIGADVMLFPASQASDLAGFDPGSMRLIPIESLDEAIAALTDPLAA